MTFDSFVANSKNIFDTFPNEQVWLQGGFLPNRQLRNPEAGYCIVIRYDESTTGVISSFMEKVRAILPPVVEYNQQSFHTTIGVYGKEETQGFVPDAEVLSYLNKSVEEGLRSCEGSPYVEFGRWLFNHEAVLVSGYPNKDLWHLIQNIETACKKNGFPLEMGRIVHITTARFISGVTHQLFEQFVHIMKTAPAIEPTKPQAVDLASWRCDGLTFDLVTHERHGL
jgi:hypothetical protein